jgi:hypothetical protein
MGQLPIPHLIENTFLLYVLNGLLSCTAVLVQPMWLPKGAAVKKPLDTTVKTSSRGTATKAPAKTMVEAEAPVAIGLVILPLQIDSSDGPSVRCKGMPFSMLSSGR